MGTGVILFQQHQEDHYTSHLFVNGFKKSLVFPSHLLLECLLLWSHNSHSNVCTSYCSLLWFSKLWRDQQLFSTLHWYNYTCFGLLLS